MHPKKLFSFDSGAQAYVADAAVVCCFDERIRRVISEFLRHHGILRPDMIVVAGGALTLASPQKDFHREFVLDQVRLAIRLHQAQRVLLMSHSDCATYGGLARFGGNQDQELAHHTLESKKAQAVVRKECPALTVERFFVAFDGVFAFQD